MKRFRKLLIRFLVLASCTASAYAVDAADSDADALSFEGVKTESLDSSQKSTRIFFEGAVGNASQRYLPDRRTIGRGTLDVAFTTKLAEGLRWVFSDRIDALYPKSAGGDVTINSLREAFLSWQPTGQQYLFEFGRINLRYGVAYGYNPTDFFRDGSLRTLTSANPFAVRDNRLGTVMLRGQRLWDGGSLSLSYSPELARRPSSDGWSLDLGSTNNRDRLLLNLSHQISPGANTQLIMYKEAGESTAIGANFTALVSDATTIHGEWTYSRERSLLARALTLPTGTSNQSRAVAGFTFTTKSKLSVTAEYQYNGFGLGGRAWADLASTQPLGQVAYLVEAQRLQELAPRSALFLYVSQKDFVIRDLDLTAFIRVNQLDSSKMVWLELRRHWPKFDLAFQIQQHIGRAGSEFGILPDRRVLQLLGTYYF